MAGSIEPQRLFTAFNGAIITKIVPDATKAFVFEVEFHKAPWPQSLKGKKPPLQFHPHQQEYMQVLEGSLAIEVEGEEILLSKNDGELAVRPWVNHRLYPPSDFGGNLVIKFLLSADTTPEAFQLDTIFFENWYGYQDEVVLNNRDFDIIQVMNILDAGGSYLTLPSWLPLKGYVAQALGILIGRWIGGLLGYQPFHRKWTKDWALACQKMEGCYLQRRFADREKQA